MFLFYCPVSLLLPEDEKIEDGTTATDPNKTIEDKWYPQLAYASDKAILMEVEELEEKVFSASLQVKVSRSSLYLHIFKNTWCDIEKCIQLEKKVLELFSITVVRTTVPCRVFRCLSKKSIFLR